MPADPLEMMFREFCLPTMAARFAELMASAEAQNWGYRKLLLQMCEAEAADRRERKRERLLRESGLPSGKTLGNLEEGHLPAKVRRQLPHAPGGRIHRTGGECAGIRPAGAGQDPTFCVPWAGNWFYGTPARCISRRLSKLVQQLLVAKRELRLDKLLKKLDRFFGGHIGRSGLRSAIAGGDGGALHVPGGAL